jgi:hypothetical protein
MRRTLIPIAIVAGLLTAGLPTTAGAASVDQIVSDCTHSSSNSLSGTYSRSDLERALHNLPADVAEYYGCADMIRAALLSRHSGNGTSGPSSGAGGGTGGSGGIGSGGTNGSGGPGTSGGPLIRNHGTAAPVSIGGTPVIPGAANTAIGGVRSLPMVLIVVLIVLGAGALAGAGVTIQRLVLARRPT